MKYSLPFYVGNPYLQKADEISIKYDVSSEVSLIDFLDEHIGQRIVLRIAKNNHLTDKNYQFLQAVVKQYAEGTVVLCFEELTSIGTNFRLPHFFKYYCTDIEQALALAEKGVTDIYVTDNLCYWLKEVRDKVKCNIRVFPNWAQSSIDLSNPYTKFFIRPEDVNLFEPYIDYLEFYTTNVKLAADLYEIYCIKKSYTGWLEILITGLPHIQVHNECIDPLLATERLNCHKSCTYWSNCKLCEKWFSLAQTLYNAKYVIKLKEQEEAANESKDM